MLGRDEIFGLVTHGGCRIGFLGVAARLFEFLDDKRLIALLIQVGDECLLFMLYAYERGSVARDLPFLRQHQRDRLAAEPDLVVVERTEWRAFFRRDIVLPGMVRAGHAGPVLVGEHVEHAFDTQRLAGVDARDAPLRDGRFDDAAIGEAAGVEFAGIFGFASDLGAAVDAWGGSADVIHHDMLIGFSCRTGIVALPALPGSAPERCCAARARP